MSFLGIKRRRASFGRLRPGFGSGYMVNVGQAGRRGKTGMYRATGYGGTRRRSGYTRTGGRYATLRRGRLTYGPAVSWKNYDLNGTAIVPAAPSASLVVGAARINGCFFEDLAQNTTATTRIGRKVLFKSIELKGYVINTAGAVADDIYFAYLVLDTQANGARPAIGDIFSYVGCSAALNNLDNSSRFRTLKRWVVRLPIGQYTGTAATYSQVIMPFHKVPILSLSELTLKQWLNSTSSSS